MPSTVRTEQPLCGGAASDAGPYARAQIVPHPAARAYPIGDIGPVVDPGAASLVGSGLWEGGGTVTGWWRALSLLVALGVVPTCGSGGDTPSGGGDDEPPPVVMHLLPTDVRVNESLDAHTQAPEICAFGNLVFVVWMDGRNGGWSIYFNRSTDGGLTWSPTDTRIDRSPAAAPSCWSPRMTCCGERVYVVWRDERSGLSDLYVNRSVDGGVSWQPSDVRLDQDLPGAADSYDPEIVCTGDLVYVVWEDYRRAVEDVHLSVSHDAGQTWAISDVRLNEDDDILAGANNPGLCVEGDEVFVHWSRERSSQRDVVGRWSASVGNAWEPERMVNTNAPGTSWSWLSWAAAPGGGLVHAVWHDNRSDGGVGAGRDIYYNHSANGGRSWGASDVPLNLNPASTNSVGAPILCASDQNVFVAWLHSSLFVSSIIRARRSVDGGQSWTASEEDVVQGPVLPSMIGNYSHVVAECDSDHVFVAWNDNRVGPSLVDAYLNYAPWNGPFQLADLRANTPAAGTTFVQEVDLCTSGGAAFLVWVDDRDGHRAVYANVLRP